MNSVVKTTQGYTIIKKRSGRYGVRRPNGTWVNGEEKVKILSAEGLIKVSAPSPKTEKAEPAS